MAPAAEHERWPSRVSFFAAAELFEAEGIAALLKPTDYTRAPLACSQMLSLGAAECIDWLKVPLWPYSVNWRSCALGPKLDSSLA
jgi:hypothetical protein